MVIIERLKTHKFEKGMLMFGFDGFVFNSGIVN